MRIGAGQSAEIAAVADGHARHEKIHHRRRLFAPRIFPGPLGLRQQQAGRQRNDAKQRKKGSCDLGHGLPYASDGTVTREASANNLSQKPDQRKILDGLAHDAVSHHIWGGGVDAQQDRQDDVAPDGRFLINMELESALLMNWTPEAKK